MTETRGRWGVHWEVSMGLENWPFNRGIGVGVATEPAKATARPGVAVGKPDSHTGPLYQRQALTLLYASKSL